MNVKVTNTINRARMIAGVLFKHALKYRFANNIVMGLIAVWLTVITFTVALTSLKVFTLFPFLIGFPLFIVTAGSLFALVACLVVSVLMKWEEFGDDDPDNRYQSVINYTVFDFFKHLYNKMVLPVFNEIKDLDGNDVR